MELIFLLILLLIAAAFGMRIMRFTKLGFSDFAEEAVFSLPIGLGLIAYLVFILGLSGFLYKGHLLFLLFILALFSFREIARILKTIISQARFIMPGSMTGWQKLLVAFFVAAIVFTLIGAFAPPICNDSLAYRLAHVRIFIESHKISHIPYTRESLWPYLIEMLFALGMALKSDILAKLIAWSFGLLPAFLVYIAGRNNFSKTGGWISAVIFLLTPAIFTQMTYSYVDIALAMYAFISLICLIKYVDSGDMRWAILAGVYSGFMLSIKYVALIVLPSLGAVGAYGIICRRSVRKEAVKVIFVFLVFFVLFSCLWYIRSFAITGNPVYPFFAKVFGGHGWERSIDKAIGQRFSAGGLIGLPWRITMFPEEFGGEHVGIAYLLFIPLAIFLKKSKIFFRSVGLFALIYAATWFFVFPKAARCLFPALLPLSVIAGCALSAALEKRGYFYNFLKMLFVAVCLLNTGLLVYYNMDKVKVSLGIESRDSYLSRTERTYDLSRYVDKNLPKAAKILMIGEIRSYYLGRPYIHMVNLVDEERIPQSMLKDEKFLDDLIKYNIDYVLLQGRADDYTYPWLYRLTNSTSLFSDSFIDREGQKYFYNLYKLNRS